MNKLKISELFYSIQGEGRYMGVPSVFLRTFGCNFKCAGFGMPKGQESIERIEIAKNNYKDYKSLPLVSTGCDSYASWDPNFKHLSDYHSTDDIVNRIMDLLPGNAWNDTHLVITGGEPLLGWQQLYPELLSHKQMLMLKELTFETNGTQSLHQEFEDYLIYEWLHYGRNRQYDQLTFSVSPKLSISGETWSDAIKPDVVTHYEEIGYTYLKFVISSKEDILEVDEAVNEYRKAGFVGPVYLMPVGGTERVYSTNNRNVANLAMQKGYRYSDRLHVGLWKNAWGT